MSIQSISHAITIINIVLLWLNPIIEKKFNIDWGLYLSSYSWQSPFGASNISEDLGLHIFYAMDFLILDYSILSSNSYETIFNWKWYMYNDEKKCKCFLNPTKGLMAKKIAFRYSNLLWGVCFDSNCSNGINFATSTYHWQKKCFFSVEVLFFLILSTLGYPFWGLNPYFITS